MTDAINCSYPCKDLQTNIISPYCAGPVSGCGQLIDYTTPCLLLAYNCKNEMARKFFKFLHYV